MNLESLALEVARVGGGQDQIGRRLASIENRIESLQQHIDQRFGLMGTRFGQIDTRFGWLIGLGFTAWTITILTILIHH